MLRLVLAASFVLRLALIGYGEWQDAHMEVKYTDVDYQVVTDAAQRMLEGGSPYERSTFRYTPLLALLLAPNVFLHRAFGKVLFSVCDVAVGAATYSLLQRQGATQRGALAGALLWLCNPYTFTISTRGNGDALTTLSTLALLHAALSARSALAGALLGFLVHWRLFPIIYTPALLLFFSAQVDAAARKMPPPLPRQLWFAGLANSSSLAFGAACGATLLALTAACTAWCGRTFLDEALLYHLARKDPRHNFSPHFYSTYLLEFGPQPPPAAAATAHPAAVGAAAAAAMQLALALRFAPRLPLCLFLQTVAFVAFNKVCTAQYFVWYFGLLPLVVLDITRAQTTRFCCAAAMWLLTQLHWLLWAYLLEFKGLPVFSAVWAASSLFLLAHVYVLWLFIRHCRSRYTFHDLCVSGKRPAKAE